MNTMALASTGQHWTASPGFADVDDLIRAVAYEFNLQLAARPAIFRQFPLVHVQEDYQGHAVDVIYTDDPRPTRLPRHSSRPKKPSKPRAAL